MLRFEFYLISNNYLCFVIISYLIGMVIIVVFFFGNFVDCFVIMVLVVVDNIGSIFFGFIRYLRVVEGVVNLVSFLW